MDIKDIEIVSNSVAENENKSTKIGKLGCPIRIHIHKYIIGHYNPSVRITTYLFTPLMLRALILYMSDGV